MTKRPTKTTALSAIFQASNALSPLLRMQLPRSVAGRPLQPCGIVPKRRKVPPPPGLPFLQRLRQSPDCPSRFFVSPPHPVVPFVAFADASQQLPPEPSLPPRSRHSATIHATAAPPGACGANSHDRKRRRVAHPSRSRHEVPPEKGEHRTETHPLFRDFPQLFRASPRAQSNAPRQHPRSVRPTATLRTKTPSALTFFAYRFASLPIPPYLCADTCPQNFAPSVVKWPWLGFFSSPCCRNWW